MIEIPYASKMVCKFTAYLSKLQIKKMAQRDVGYSSHEVKAVQRALKKHHYESYDPGSAIK